MTANKAVQLNSFDQLTSLIKTRVEPVEIDIDGTKVTMWVREMNGSTTSELMKRSPNTFTTADGSTVTDNSTNNLDMAFVLARCVVQADDHTKALKPGRAGEQAWNALPARILKPLFTKAIEMSDLADSQDEVGNDEESS